MYLPPLMLSYNTSFHKSVLNTPHYLTFGNDARLPNFPAPNLQRKFYCETTSDDLHRTLLYARDLARQHNEDAANKFKGNHDRKATQHNYKFGQLVLLDEHSFLHKNQKLAPKWSGPHRITKVKNDTNVELLLKNGKHLIVHVDRLKPYIMQPPTPDSHDDNSVNRGASLPPEVQNNDQLPEPRPNTPQNEEQFEEE